jgi:hypothetical protein
MSALTILLIIALICFLIAAFNIGTPPVNLTALGLAFVTIAMLVSRSGF